MNSKDMNASAVTYVLGGVALGALGAMLIAARKDAGRGLRARPGDRTGRALPVRGETPAVCRSRSEIEEELDATANL